MVQARLLQRPARNMDKPFILIAGAPKEFERARSLLGRSGLDTKVIGRVGINGDAKQSLTPLAAVEKVARGVGARELVFCAGKLSYKDIIGRLQTMRTSMRMRFHGVGSESIVGSDSSGTTGDVFGGEPFHQLAQAAPRRLKRLADVLAAVLFLITFPLHLILVPHPLRFMTNCISVLFARKTWVGYIAGDIGLPRLRAGVLAPNGQSLLAAGALPPESIQLVDYSYARDYEPIQDLKLLAENYRRLGS